MTAHHNRRGAIDLKPDDHECIAEGCTRSSRGSGCGRGYCSRHYYRVRKHGHPDKGRTPPGSIKKWLDAHRDHQGDDCLLLPFVGGKGYGSLKLSSGRSTKPSRYMCQLAHGNPPSSAHHAAHTCGKGHLGCVNPRHLMWKTPAENQADRLIHGTDIRGEKHGNSKLTRVQAMTIIRVRGRVSQRQLAKRYGVAQSTIHAVQSGQNWHWLGELA